MRDTTTQRGSWRWRCFLVGAVAAAALPASASWWSANYNESAASGMKSCAVMSASGLTVIMGESADGERRQQVVVYHLRYGTRAYLAWGDERFATAPAGARDIGVFNAEHAPRIVHLLASQSPAYEWTASDRDIWKGESLGVGRFASRYGECLQKMGWGDEEDFRREVEPHPIDPGTG